jgi:hypothetical protein
MYNTKREIQHRYIVPYTPTDVNDFFTHIYIYRLLRGDEVEIIIRNKSMFPNQCILLLCILVLCSIVLLVLNT